MTITKFFQTSGDLLQFVLPTVVGVQDVASDVQQGKYDKAGEKALKILVLIGVQRYGCKLIKQLAKKKRPDGSDFESFPSGHFMIGAQCLARSCHRDGFPSVMAILDSVVKSSLLFLIFLWKTSALPCFKSPLGALSIGRLELSS